MDLLVVLIVLLLLFGGGGGLYWGLGAGWGIGRIGLIVLVLVVAYLLYGIRGEEARDSRKNKRWPHPTWASFPQGQWSSVSYAATGGPKLLVSACPLAIPPPEREHQQRRLVPPPAPAPSSCAPSDAMRPDAHCQHGQHRRNQHQPAAATHVVQAPHVQDHRGYSRTSTPHGA